MSQWVRLPGLLRRSLFGALEHDSLNLSQSAAYSAIFALFPALIVVAALMSWLPVFAPVQMQLAAFFGQILPSSVFPLLTSYFGSNSRTPHTTQLLLVAAFVSLTGASSVIATLMEGLRRAEDLPNNCWSFWQRRSRALLLVPLSLIPLVIATGLVMFGELITQWLADSMSTSMRPVFYGFTLAARWSLALAAVATVTAVLYHVGTPPREMEVRAQNPTQEPARNPVQDPAASLSREAGAKLWRKVCRSVPRGWNRTLPGAIVATVAWFAITLSFGWYVTRFANYSQVYGPLGAGIALLVWLYIVFFSVLLGAEFNAQFRRNSPAPPAPGTNPETPNAIG